MPLLRLRGKGRSAAPSRSLRSGSPPRDGIVARVAGALRHRLLRGRHSFHSRRRPARPAARRAAHPPSGTGRCPHLLRGQSGRRNARNGVGLAAPGGTHPEPRRAVLRRPRATLPRPPPRRFPCAGGGPRVRRGGLRHGVPRPHLRPARPVGEHPAREPGHRRRPRPRSHLLLPVDGARRHRLRPPPRPRPAGGDAGGRAGRTLRARPRRARTRRLARVRGQQLRPGAAPSIAPQHEVLAPPAVPGARSLRPLLRRHATLVEPPRHRGVPGRNRRG